MSAAAMTSQSGRPIKRKFDISPGDAVDNSMEEDEEWSSERESKVRDCFFW